MTENLSVNLEENSKYRVAWDMAKAIAHIERGHTKDREYFLRLTRQCYETIYGYGYKSIDEIITETKTKSPSMEMSY